MNTQRVPVRDVHAFLLLGGALAIVALYAVEALVSIARGAGVGAGVVLGLLLLSPARAAWRGDGRAGFWYALLSTLVVAHGLSTAASAGTRGFGVALLGAALSMFVVACAFARRYGLRLQQDEHGE